MKSENTIKIRESWIKQLYIEFDRICYHYKLRLPSVLIDVREMERTLGQYDPNRKMIVISESLIRDHSWDIVLEVFKHEIAHQIVADNGGSPENPHGQAFQAACARVGTQAWACKASLNLPSKKKTHEPTSEELDKKRVDQKISKLLALGASSNENEAMLAISKAQS